MPEITTEWQRFATLSADELYELLRFRQNIFVVEQCSPYPDLDGLDQSAWHLLARSQGALAGYLRLMHTTGPPPVVRIGRIAVSSRFRRQGVGRTLVEEALRFCDHRYRGLAISLGAQARLVSFYRALGFESTGEEYDDYGVPHVEMRKAGSN